MLHSWLGNSLIPRYEYDCLQLNDQVKSQFTFRIPTRKELKQIFASLAPKRSYGHDEISSALVKKQASSLLEPMDIILEKMIITSIFPPPWKLSLIHI